MKKWKFPEKPPRIFGESWTDVKNRLITIALFGLMLFKMYDVGTYNGMITTCDDLGGVYAVEIKKCISEKSLPIVSPTQQFGNQKLNFTINSLNREGVQIIAVD